MERQFQLGQSVPDFSDNPAIETRIVGLPARGTHLRLPQLRRRNTDSDPEFSFAKELSMTAEEIKDRAYKIWEAWGRPDDMGGIIWDQAKRELQFQEEVARRKLLRQ